ncbi:MAG: DUF3365 domain-containing protein [Zoogloeaceae bacterium]|nr:DUF3365 domain-containing protein [Zoogloeaceae bacterium]
MKAMQLKKAIAAASVLAAVSIPGLAQQKGWSYEQVADALHLVLETDRTVYTRLIVNRLANQEKVIEAHEDWLEKKALVLPAQMFRAGSEMVAEKGAKWSYRLISEWPINDQNVARTPAEMEGLKAVAANGAKPFYKEETIGGTKYFTAVYADRAVARACVSCHNDHKSSPRNDFKMGETMGAVVLRLPM